MYNDFPLSCECPELVPVIRMSEQERRAFGWNNQENKLETKEIDKDVEKEWTKGEKK